MVCAIGVRTFFQDRRNGVATHAHDARDRPLREPFRVQFLNGGMALCPLVVLSIQGAIKVARGVMELPLSAGRTPIFPNLGRS